MHIRSLKCVKSFHLPIVATYSNCALEALTKTAEKWNWETSYNTFSPNCRFRKYFFIKRNEPALTARKQENTAIVMCSIFHRLENHPMWFYLKCIHVAGIKLLDIVLCWNSRLTRHQKENLIWLKSTAACSCMNETFNETHLFSRIEWNQPTQWKTIIDIIIEYPRNEITASFHRQASYFGFLISAYVSL